MIFTRKTGKKIVIFQGNEKIKDIVAQIFTISIEKHRGRVKEIAWELGVCGYTVRKKIKASKNDPRN